MFDGLMSRCTMRRLCACSSAAATSMSMGRILVYAAPRICRRSPPVASTMGSTVASAVAHRLVDAQDAGVIEPRRQRELALEDLPGGFRIANCE
jgi:hypothetical protein